jgi:hypothetical protein
VHVVQDGDGRQAFVEKAMNRGIILNLGISLIAQEQVLSKKELSCVVLLVS